MSQAFCEGYLESSSHFRIALMNTSARAYLILGIYITFKHPFNGQGPRAGTMV